MMKVSSEARVVADDMHSHYLRANSMPWEKTRFPGIEVKTLLFDPKTGLATTLMRMQPGATVPDHEHVLIEQTFVIEGKLVDIEGPDVGLEVGPGEFVWRPAGHRHTAQCPDGGIMLAIFQVPNKFFERDGRVIDSSGKDWKEMWGHTGAG
jgi:anti-sigma factor ChrR (cupin superfamily)